MPKIPSETTILVVDDSKVISQTAELFLKPTGYKVVTCSNGFDALSVIMDVKPDLLILDVMMPRLDGYNACLLIRNNHDFEKLPIVMLTSKDGSIDRAKGLMVGCSDYLTKPFSKDSLLECVRKNLELDEERVGDRF